MSRGDPCERRAAAGKAGAAKLFGQRVLLDTEPAKLSPA